MDRREFLKWSVAAGAGMTVVPLGAAAVNLPDPPQKAVLKLSCQEGVAPGRDL
ncbi:MAG: sugar phosphate isomerase/epimerase, partial [Calditrichaeota bacterium]|nr:sugar phosphate isomerase/epimerase [Calditrichota bacterium]